jgi:hypothetical protein
MPSVRRSSSSASATPAQRAVHELSGGQQQRVALARALGSLPIEAHIEGEVDVLVRPEGLAVGVSGPSSAASAEVVSRRFFGHDQLLGLKLASGRVVRSRRLGYPAWHPGDHVQVWIEGPVEVLPRAAATVPAAGAAAST